MDWAEGIGILVGVTVGIFVVFSVGTLVWVKQTIRGRIYLYVLEHNNRVTKQLAKIDPDGKAELDGQKYDIDSDYQFDTYWPAGLPSWMQEPVRSQWHLRNQPEPMDVRKAKMSIVSARSRNILSDQRLLETMWSDIRRELGIAGKGMGLKNWTVWVWVLTLVAVVALGGMMWMMWSKINHIDWMIGG